MVYLLRRACLGQAIDADHARALTGERLLRPDGTVEPVLREIVLSSVRGQGRLLHLDSPFTETLDRVMAEYIQSREYVRCSLPLREAEAFLASDPVERSVRRVLKATAPESNWTDRRDDNDGPTR